jgi:D-amino-acid dehydrogenase
VRIPIVQEVLTVYDAVVVGGGLLGVATAYHLVRGGAKTLLVDRSDPGRATDAGAGILSPETNSRDPDAWIHFALRAVAYYRTLLEYLASDGAGETGYARCGMLVVAAAEDERAPYAAARAQIFRRREQRDAPREEDLHEVSPADARRMFPPLAEVHGALYYRHAARVDGRLLSLALRWAAERRGLVVMPASADLLVLANHRVTGILVGGTAVPASRVAITGGAWSDAFGEQLGTRVPVAPQRGQIIHLRNPQTATADWPIVSAFHGHYMVPWPDSRVVVGATRETGRGFDPRLTAAGVREVLDEAIRVAPGLIDWEIHEMRVGLRPLSEDGLPVLGPVPGVDGVFLATGHGPSGLQLGPYSGKVTADLMLGRPAEIDLTPFGISRFATAQGQPLRTGRGTLRGGGRRGSRQ